MTQDKSIIIALIRCTLANNPNEATIHQVRRLRDYYLNVDDDFSIRINDILNPPPGHLEITGKLVQS